MFEYEVKEHVVTLSETDTQSKELNVVSWNGRPGRYDLRIWRQTQEGRKPSKGITLSDEELRSLAAALGKILNERSVEG